MFATFSFTKLVVHDLEASKRFYERVFGLSELHRIEAEIAGAAIEEIVMGQGDTGEEWPADALILLKFKAVPAPNAGAVILGFTTDDLEALRERVSANGGSLVGEIEAMPERQIRVGFAKDPEGNLAELVEVAGASDGDDSQR